MRAATAPTAVDVACPVQPTSPVKTVNVNAQQVRRFAMANVSTHNSHNYIVDNATIRAVRVIRVLPVYARLQVARQDKRSVAVPV